MIELIVCFILIAVCILFIYTAEFITDDTGESVSLRYILKVLPHIPRHIWNTLWIRGYDEYHKTLDLDDRLLLSLNKKDGEMYLKDLERRRQKAHEKSLWR